MKNILGMLMLINLLHASEVEIFEGREGFKFGLGVVVVGSCWKEEEWDEKGENIVDRERYCGALPLLDLELGYNISNKFGLSLDMKTLIIGSLVGIKAKYYMQDAKDTAYVALTGGALGSGNAHGGFVGSYNNIEYGYAYGKKEFSIGVGVPYGDRDVLVHVGYKYIF